MKKKIYNKKNFRSGMCFLSIAIMGSIVSFLKGCDKFSCISMIKSIILNFLLLFMGISYIYRSLNYRYSKEDIQDDDEREKLLSLKAESSSLSFSTGFCFVFEVILMIAFGITKNNGIIAPLICVGLIFNVLLISPVFAYIYHNKRI
ncbi:hypothetical protein [Clostridium botulinum]|uniref:hypothetical protein n=1 Tax=Clostridium botulinum TaxID=1491 RepID=UPI0006A51475|nr:hypothetical protein [Clostridium botulinum]KOC31251.1 hypothetical protein ADU81_14035 [Clostridium botulinum]